MYVFDSEAKEYKLTRDKSKDTPKVCSETFWPILYMGKNKTPQRQHGTFIHKNNQTNPLAFVNTTSLSQL